VDRPGHRCIQRSGSARFPFDELVGREAIDRALKADGPAIIDCVVAADELPNVPHLELETMENYAEAKIKEAILAVTGG
jgi:pyruvate dehydrogenase (quinone)